VSPYELIATVSAGGRSSGFDKENESEQQGDPAGRTLNQIDREDKRIMLEASEQLEHLKLAANVAGLEVPRFILPEDHDVVVNRMRFHYLDWGTAGRHPILFLHGGGLNAHTWDLVCLALHAEYHCLALDQRGHGDSEWSPVGDYSLPVQVRDIEDFIEKLKLKRPLVVGHSMGGFAAMAYAAKFARRMAGLALVDIAPELNPSGTERIRNFLAQDRELDSVDAFVERAMAFNPLRNPALLRRSLLHNLRELPNGKWTWKHDPNRVRPTPESMRARQEEITKEVSQITCPTLVLRGAKSDVLTDESAADFAKALPDGRWMRVEDAAHTVQGDNPRGLVKALRPFLREIKL
jgi:esterase